MLVTFKLLCCSPTSCVQFHNEVTKTIMLFLSVSGLVYLNHIVQHCPDLLDNQLAHLRMLVRLSKPVIYYTLSILYHYSVTLPVYYTNTLLHSQYTILILCYTLSILYHYSVTLSVYHTGLHLESVARGGKSIIL